MYDEQNKSFPLFWKRAILILLFFTFTPIALLTSVFSLVSLTNHNDSLIQENVSLIEHPQSGVRVYASLPSDFPSISSEVTTEDARPEIIKQYLASYNSPLQPYASLIVATADKYNLDYRLITAIAQQESNLCKKAPEGTYNCWGWGIHSKGTLGFSSYQEGIEIVSKGLRDSYLDEGYLTVSDIMGKYTPLSNGSWANGVNIFMSDLQ